MFERSSYDGEEKIIHNGVLSGDKVVYDDKLKLLSVPGVQYVSFLSQLFKRNAIFNDFGDLCVHRDMLINYMNCLYESEKQVFHCIKIASTSILIASSKHVIIKRSLRTKRVSTLPIAILSTNDQLSFIITIVKLKLNPRPNTILISVISNPLNSTTFHTLSNFTKKNQRSDSNWKHRNKNKNSNTNADKSLFHNATGTPSNSDCDPIDPSDPSGLSGSSDMNDLSGSSRRSNLSDPRDPSDLSDSSVLSVAPYKGTDPETRENDCDRKQFSCTIPISSENIHEQNQEAVNYPMRSTEDVTSSTVIVIVIHACHYLSVDSIAKAWSSLRTPSIITSLVCHPACHPHSIWPLSLSSLPLELRLRPHKVSLSNQILPNWVSIHYFFINQINPKKTKLTCKSDLLRRHDLNISDKLNSLDYRSKTLKINPKINPKMCVYDNKQWSINFGSLKYLKQSRTFYEEKSDKIIGCVSWSHKLILLSGDVELNPGPLDLTLVTINCRGLKKEQKFKQLINRLRQSPASDRNLIVSLQETHVEYNSLKYTWKGQHVFTPGDGAKGGIISLLSDNIIIREKLDIDKEAQISLLEILDDSQKQEIILANIHSPCAHNQDKVDFFAGVRLELDKFIEKYTEAKVILMGDFNTTFLDGERKGTIRSRTEIRCADKILGLFSDLSMVDCWTMANEQMTWRHGEKMSRLDRIQWSDELNTTLISTETDWSYTQSDHCAVIVRLGQIQPRRRDKIVRIDTSFMSNVQLKHKFLVELDLRMDQMSDTNMNPHQQLEYLKMSIRSIAIEIASNHRKERNKKLENLRNEIKFWQSAFESASSDNFKDLAVVKLDEVTCKRDKILDEIGEFICARMKSRWYQEGEKGTKYFLNLQKSKGKKLELGSLIVEGSITEDSNKIDKAIESFYKNLYEKGDSNSVNVGEIKSLLKNLSSLDNAKIKMVNNAIGITDLFSTLQSCSDSSPGPDGIPYSLIKLTWKHFGQILLNSWNYAHITGCLTVSHESSYLKLLPKDGKDHTLLKNWRPITLSNCDFKIITKTLAIKLTNGLSEVISPQQTAYIKNRQITDNLHILQHTTSKCSELNTQSMIVSLDAEKAFDSVEHWYLKEVLKKVGLSKFVQTFELIYRNQNVSIQVNNREAGRYKIKNGVKQGDALSCILFILGIEPLIKNINQDRNITAVKIHDLAIPKVVAYADDVACITTPNQRNLQSIFDHYEKLSKVSGLCLNADKTELISNLNTSPDFRVTYLKKNFNIKPSTEIKINGLYINYDMEMSRLNNFNKIYNSVESQLKAWSNRNLSILGKIQIFKTFGLSQILFVATTNLFSTKEEKQLDNLIYKFIWNRDITKNKAPDRIKRSILKREIRNLGFGMIDFRDIINSIRIKTVLRLMNDHNHPLNSIIKSNISSSVINMKIINKINPVIDATVALINRIWKNTLKSCPQEIIPEYSDIILNEYIGNIIYPRYKNKRMALYFRHYKLGEVIKMDENHSILKKIDNVILRLLSSLNYKDFDPNKTATNFTLFPIKLVLMKANKLTTKQIRYSLENVDTNPPKVITSPDQPTLISLGNIIKKLTNERLKTTILRSLHGDIYCGTRLKKFGMTDSDLCSRCNAPESIAHQLMECEYVKKIWNLLTNITSIKVESLNDVLGHNPFHDRTTLTIHAEVIRLLLAIDRPTINQITMIKNVINRLSLVERGITKYQINKMKEIIQSLT